VNTAAQPLAVKGADSVPPAPKPPAEVPPPPAVPAPPASPVAVEAVAATPAAGRTPLALSHDAPDTAPSVGVIGGSDGSGPSPAATPEPSTLLLMGAGLAGLYRLRRRR
ncbi:MAG: PEP-CTERM sorting domain-containing protein, partial [Vicinamibacterales bacterium]